MNKYFAFEYEVGGTPTYGLFPLSTDCSMQMGYYNPVTKELVMQSKNTMESLKFVEKTDEFKRLVEVKGKQAFEKRTLVEHLTFRLADDAKEAFINEFVHNKELIDLILTKIDEFIAANVPAEAPEANVLVSEGGGDELGDLVPLED